MSKTTANLGICIVEFDETNYGRMRFYNSPEIFHCKILSLIGDLSSEKVIIHMVIWKDPDEMTELTVEKFTKHIHIKKE